MDASRFLPIFALLARNICLLQDYIVEFYALLVL